MSFVRVPPDSTGKKVYTVEQTVGADTVQAQVLHVADRHTPTQFLAVDNQGSASVRFAEGQPILAGFGGLKVSQERILGVYESSLDSYDALFSIGSSSGGQLSYNPIESSQILSVTGVDASTCIITTNRYHYYAPGTANVFKGTVSFGDAGTIGNHRTFGMYDDNDGVFFQLYDADFYVGIRSSVTGSVVERKFARTNWNLDRLDGTGASGLTLDVTRVNVYWIDYQWLGAGRVRFGIFAPDGSRVVCHVFENAGLSALPYMRTGTLPIRVENHNHATTGSNSEIRSVCLAAYTEGTYEDYAFWRHAGPGVTHTVSTQDQYLSSIRSIELVNGKHNSVVVYPEDLNVYSDQPFELSFWQNTIVDGATWFEVPGLTLELTSTGTVDYTSARKFKTFYFPAGVSTLDLTKYFEFNDEAIQRNSDGSPAPWSVSASPLTASPANIRLNLNYRELW